MDILFFAPYSEVWVSSMPEALVARELCLAGHRVHMFRCDTSLREYCPAMTSHGLSFFSNDKEKRRVCSSCIGARRILDQELNLTSSDFGDYMSDYDPEYTKLLLEHVDGDNWHDFKINGLPLGRYASYEVLLNHKISDFSLISSVWDEYTTNLEQCLMAHSAITSYFKNNKVDHVVVYNSLYSLNRTVVKTAEAKGITWSTIHGGKNIRDMLQTLTIASNDSQDILLAKSNLWESWKSIPLNMDEIENVGKYLKYLFAARSAFTYSTKKRRFTAKELRKYFGVENSRKVILCCLASEDERFAADAVGSLDFKMTEGFELFQNNEEWLLFLFDFIRNNEDFHLIVRYHPRLFPNKREAIKAQVVSKFEKLFNDRPERVSINNPDDKISLYDLAEIVDVVANATSNAGIELLALGIPVVNHCPEKLFAYPQEFNFTGTTRESYENAIFQAVECGWSIENSINAFRYRSFLFTKVTFSLHDAVPSRTTFSILRVLTWLRFRKGKPVPAGLINYFRYSEIKRSPTNLRDGNNIVAAILSSKLQVPVLAQGSETRNPDVEILALRKLLAKMGKKYFAKGEPGALRSKLQGL